MKFFLDASSDLDHSLLENSSISGIFGQTSLDIPSYQIDGNRIIYQDAVIGKRLVIDSPEAMSEAMDLELDDDYQMILVETGDWHIIPIENLIAKFNSLSAELVATASTPEEIKLLQNILELGVDGILLQSSEQYPIIDLLASIEDDGESIELHALPVTSVTRIGNGDRVCVDTVSLLGQGEGMLVGSTAAVMILIQAEVEESGFVNSRPFRINAGVVASYTLNFDKTNYLSELEAGKSVMIVDQQGRSRKEFVARVKIERRPLLVIKCQYQDREYATVVQDAETVKVVTPRGAVRVDQLQPKDKVLAYISTKARHFGMAIDEFLEEK